MQKIRLGRFWREIKRRNVHRSLAVYGGTAYIIFEAANMIFPRWGFPDWTIDLLLYLLILGAIITAIVSWMYDISPEGVEKTRSVEDVEEVEEKDRRTGSNAWKIATYVSLVVIVGLILYNIVNSNRVRTNLFQMEKSIAVLPFDNLSPDPNQLWFAESISDVISSQLSKIAGYRVIGRKSTERFRDKEKNIADIGEALGVNLVVDGAVQKHGDSIRIITQLILVRNETYLWSEIYNGDWNEIFKIQTDIAKKVAGSLQTALSPEEDERIAFVGTQDPEAYEYYLQGNELMKMISELNMWKAIDKYKQAIELDDHFAEAYARLSSAYFELTIPDVPDPDSSYIPVARKWAFNALELKSNLAEPHFVLGAISYNHDWDWKAAEKSFKMGMELDSSYLWGLTYYANFLTFMGRFNESISISEYSLRLDPLDPGGYLELAFAYANLGQDEKEEELLKRCLELNPDFGNPQEGLASIYATKGINLQFVYDFCEKALGGSQHDLQKIRSLNLGFIGYILATAGGKGKVMDILDELTKRIDSGNEDTPYYALGLIYNALGESEKAIDYLEKGVKIGEPFIFTIYSQPHLRTLRSNKRFQDLLTKLGFEI